jgi:hypothetical protein
MKTKEITSTVGFSLIIIVAGILITGCSTCSTYQAFPGPSLPRQQIAILKIDNDHMWVSHIDGKSLKGRSDWFGRTGIYDHRMISLLPGEHSVGFDYSSAPFNVSYRSINPFYQDINLEAGKTYIAHCKTEFRPTAGWTQDPTNPNSWTGERGAGPLNQAWWVEISEEQQP